MIYQDDEGNAVDWHHGADDTTKKIIAAKGFSGPLDSIKRYHELEQKQGRMATIPDGASSDEDWDKFNARLRPIDVAAYADVVPKGLPEGTFDEGLGTSMKKIAHEAGIPTRMFSKLWNGYWQGVGKQLADLDAKAEEIKEADTKALREKWKGDFEKNNALADKALEKSGLGKLLAEYGLGGHPLVREAMRVLALSTTEMETRGGESGESVDGDGWFSDYSEVDEVNK